MRRLDQRWNDKKKAGTERLIPELQELLDLSGQVQKLSSELTEEEWDCLRFLYKEIGRAHV